MMPKEASTKAVYEYYCSATQTRGELQMDRGARVKFKSGSKARQNWRVADGIAGLVLARYRCSAASNEDPERVDVHFGSEGIVWGERASEFEVVTLEQNLQ
jgi:hypothetical protein